MADEPAADDEPAGAARRDSAEADSAPKDGAAPDSGAKDGAKADGAPEDKRDVKKRKHTFWRDLVIIVVAALTLTILLKAFVVQVFSIPSGSMENTLIPGDRILVSKVVYRFRPIARGDIVVFSGAGSWDPATPSPGNPLLRFWDGLTNLVGIAAPGTDYVKRVIGLPGDHVRCCDSRGRVTVNGVPLNEGSYVHPGDAPSQLRFNITVPPGRLWVLGDNRADSDDSRYRMDAPGGGTIPESAVVGRAFVILWPLSRLGDLPIPETFKQPALSATAAPAGGRGAVLSPGIG